MARKSITSRAILPLLAALVVLPIAISVLVAVSALLAAMSDKDGGVALKYIALGCGILWIVDLVSLVLLQGFHALGESAQPPSDRQDDSASGHE
jgi:hypothetical protein